MHLRQHLSEFFLEREIIQTIAVEKTKTLYICSLIPRPPPPKDRAVYKIMWKNMVETDSPQITIQYGAGALHAG